MPKNVEDLQAKYFSSVQYRSPSHPVIQAYADPKINFIRSHVHLTGNLLDVGCGNGIFTVRFAAGESASVVGLDFSTHLLRQNPHERLICGDATVLPFDDNTFDAVFEANVLHHVPVRDRVVMEMSRVSRRYVILLEPNRYNPVMAGFAMLVRAERGGLKSCVSRLQQEVVQCGLKVIASITTGMVSQNNTPEILIPLLRRFDRHIWWGEYIVMIAEKM